MDEMLREGGAEPQQRRAPNAKRPRRWAGPFEVSRKDADTKKSRGEDALLPET